MLRGCLNFFVTLRMKQDDAIFKADEWQAAA